MLASIIIHWRNSRKDTSHSVQVEKPKLYSQVDLELKLSSAPNIQGWLSVPSYLTFLSILLPLKWG